MVLSPFRGFRRVLGLAFLFWGVGPLLWIALRLGLPVGIRGPLYFHRAMCRILGVHLKVRGVPSEKTPTLYVANHTSYIDIPILGAVIEGCFVAKSEVAHWPIFGFLARLQSTIFIERSKKHASTHSAALQKRLQEGRSLILFPEGTSTDGHRVLPFKTSLFVVAEEDLPTGPLPVQPVSIAYTGQDGLPLMRAFRPFYAWYGDMEMASHLWDLLKLGDLTVDITFLPPKTAIEAGGRKQLAKYCEDQVRNGLSASLSGRPENLGVKNWHQPQKPW
jgi:lyso-ornithine lipid O-acyltransferase